VTAGWAAPYFDDPAELSLPASMGGIAPVQGPFSARMLMEGQWTGPTAGPLTNGSWMPVKDLYDYAPTPQPATSQVLIDVAAGFYYQPL